MIRIVSFDTSRHVKEGGEGEEERGKGRSKVLAEFFFFYCSSYFFFVRSRGNVFAVVRMLILFFSFHFFSPHIFLMIPFVVFCIRIISDFATST